MTSRVGLVTGAAMGIGRAVAERLARDGVRLVLMDVAAEPLEQVAAALRGGGAEVQTSRGSVADGPACRAAVALAQSTFGGLDRVSHNAGIQRYGTVETTSEALWDEVIAVNLKGALPRSQARCRCSASEGRGRPHGLGAGHGGADRRRSPIRRPSTG